MVHRLHVSGEQTRAVVLDPGHMSSRFDDAVEVVVGDLTSTLSVEKVCRGASVVYNCFEPMVSRWEELSARVNSNLLLASINERAVLAMASRVFNSADDNQNMERDAIEASESGVAKVVVAQIPQVYGPGALPDQFASVFDEAIKGKRAHWGGQMDVRRSMVYILDAADALVSLANAEPAQGRRWQIAGPGPLTGRKVIEMAFQVMEKTANIGSGLWGIRGRVSIPRRFSYDYDSEFILDGSDFSLAFPGFSFTPHETAIGVSLEWYRDRLQIREGGPIMQESR